MYLIMKKIFGSFLFLMSIFLPFSLSAATPLVDVNWVRANIGQEHVVFLDVRGT